MKVSGDSFKELLSAISEKKKKSRVPSNSPCPIFGPYPLNASREVAAKVGVRDVFEADDWVNLDLIPGFRINEMIRPVFKIKSQFMFFISGVKKDDFMFVVL